MSLKDDIRNKTMEFRDQKFTFTEVNEIPTINTKQLTFGCNGLKFDAVVLYSRPSKRLGAQRMPKIA